MLYNSINHLPEGNAIYTWIVRLAPRVHVQVYAFLFQEFANLEHLVSGHGLKVSLYGISVVFHWSLSFHLNLECYVVEKLHAMV